MVMIDLAERTQVFRGRWFWSATRPALAWLRRADYLGDPAIDLDEAVRRRVHEATGQRPAGPIRMLTHLRSFGHCFNPVTFYYCLHADGERLDCIVAEITNTPWRERHSYVLPATQALIEGGTHHFAMDKAFHVSPFMPMAQQYRWKFSGSDTGLAVHMQNVEQDATVFDATLTLRRREIGTASLALALLRFPAATLRVLVAIYWQALRLKLSGVRFHAHPDLLRHDPPQ